MTEDCSEVLPRRGGGALCGALVPADDWDSAEVDAAIAADFESGPADVAAQPRAGEATA
jgi:hypothetical protein